MGPSEGWTANCEVPFSRHSGVKCSRVSVSFSLVLLFGPDGQREGVSSLVWLSCASSPSRSPLVRTRTRSPKQRYSNARGFGIDVSRGRRRREERLAIKFNATVC